MLEGERLLLAERLAGALCRAAGCLWEDSVEPEMPEWEPPPPKPEPLNPASLVAAARSSLAFRVASLVLEARRSSGCCKPLARLSAVLAATLRSEDLSEASRAPIEARLASSKPGLVGLLRLVSLAYKFERSGRLADMINLASAAAREASSPCVLDPALRAERDRLERRMKIYGILLAVSIPAAIAATIILDPVALIPSAALVVMLWWLIRRDGERFRSLNIEVAWRECRLTDKELAEIVGGLGAAEIALAYLVFGYNR